MIGRTEINLALALGMAVVACDGGASSGQRNRADGGVDAIAGRDAATGIDGGPAGAAGARYVESFCESRESAPGLRPVCGFVRLPERHDDPGAGTIDVRVATLPATAAAGTTLGAPIVFLDGGPGGSSIASAVYYAGWDPDKALQALRARHTLVAIDLRGSGGSKPSLACDDAGGPVDPVPLPATASAAAPFPAAALAACRESLRGSGASLGAYGTVDAATDVGLVARAMGLGRFHLVGVSYGAAVALELLRQGTEDVAAVVLDSAAPPETNLLLEEGAALARALDVIITACHADAACQAAAPDLQAALPEIVARLDAAPVDVSTHGGGVTLTGASFLHAVSMALQDGDVGFAQKLQQARAGDYGFFAAVLGAPRGKGSLGAHLGVMCAEQMAFTTSAAIEASAAALPPPFGAALTGRFYARACPDWAVTSSHPGPRTAVSSGVPALLLTGQVDPLRMPAWSRRIAETLPGAHVFELPGQGHAVLHRPCGAAAAARFLDDPGAPPAAPSCVRGPD